MALSENDHNSMDSMLKEVLVAYKEDGLSLNSVVSSLAHIMAALDIGNTGEAILWFNQKNLEYFKDVHNHTHFD